MSSTTRRAHDVHRFREGLQRAIAALATADASDEVMSLLADKAEELAAKVTTPEAGGAAWGYVSGSGNPAARGVLVVGLAPRTAFEPHVTRAGDVAEATVTFGLAHEGPDGAAHGGIVAALLDDFCAAAQSIGGPSALTRELVLTYHRPAPIGRPLRLQAAVRQASDRRTRVHGTLHDGDELCAEADVVYVVAQPAV